VSLQQIIPPVPLEITPDAVDVVGIVLGIIVFRQKAGAMKPVVVGPARILRPGLCEMDMAPPLLFNGV